MLSTCPTNRELLKNVVAKLTEIEELFHAQRQALHDDNADLVQELHKKLTVLYKAKEHAIEEWARHHRAHGC